MLVLFDSIGPESSIRFQNNSEKFGIDIPVGIEQVTVRDPVGVRMSGS